LLYYEEKNGDKHDLAASNLDDYDTTLLHQLKSRFRGRSCNGVILSAISELDEENGTYQDNGAVPATSTTSSRTSDERLGVGINEPRGQVRRVVKLDLPGDEKEEI